MEFPRSAVQPLCCHNVCAISLLCLLHILQFQIVLLHCEGIWGRFLQRLPQEINIAQKEHQIPSILSTARGAGCVHVPPSGRLFYVGKCSCVVSSLLLRRDRGGRYVLNSMVCYQPCCSTTDSQSCWPAASMVLVCRGGYATGWNQPQKAM